MKIWKHGDTVYIAGKGTYDHRQLLSELGCEWNREDKIWELDPEELDGLVRALDDEGVEYERGKGVKW